MENFTTLIENRRSISQLKKSEHIDQDELIWHIKQAIKHSPSAFNAQSVSAVVLLNEKHTMLWDAVLDRILPFVVADKQQASIDKIAGFKNGDGTIIFLEDTSIGDELRTKFPLYQDNVTLWADQGQGVAQYGVWLMLTEMGLSASLQHYNPLIDDYIYEHLNVDKKYKITAQMPFGKADQMPTNKKMKDINQRVFVER